MDSDFDDDRPQKVVELIDDLLGRIGFVIIDRPVNGSTAGGIRYSSDVTEDEVARLARVMTLKWAFLNLAMGGGKAGIQADLEQLGCDRASLMKAFGRSIAPLVKDHSFYPGVDLGTNMEDLEIIMREAGSPLEGGQVDSSFCTALTVFEAIKQLSDFLNFKLNDLHFVLEGFGKVGSELAVLLCNQGARMVGVSTQFGALYSESGLDISELILLKKSYGDRLIEHYRHADVIPLEALFEKPVDLIIPGARPNAINENNVDQIKARMIVPIANIPFAPQTEGRLADRGVLIVPDFVANCGGILASGMYGQGFNLQDARFVIENVYAQVIEEILMSAKKQQRSIREIAESVAWRNYNSFHEVVLKPKGAPIRVIGLISTHGLTGLVRRIAWRIFQRYPSIQGALRHAAIGRYAEMGLEVTRDRIAGMSLTGDNVST